jgi:hypothetical protein
MPIRSGLAILFLMMDSPLSPSRPARYRLHLQGVVNIDWADWLMDKSVDLKENRTILTGTVRDQAALFGLLNYIRDLGMPLLLVEYIPDYETR